mgnify:CR=1 FL=1
MYIHSVRALLNDFNKHEGVLNPYRVPIIITSAAALEAILNEAIIVECRHRFAEKDIKRITNSHLSMSLGGKLDNLGWVLTDNKYIVNNESKIYQCLRSIIKLRNEIMHLKEYYREVEWEAKEEEFEGELETHYVWDEDFLESTKSTVDKLPNEDFDRFYRAISELEVTIVNITSKPPVEENDLFIQNNA